MDENAPSPDPGRDPPATGTRRRFLRGGAVAGAALLAGCTEDVGMELPSNEKYPLSEHLPELPVTERTDVLAERIEALADADIDGLEAFEAAFDDYTLEVESVEEVRDVLTLEYINRALYDEGNLHDVGLLAGGYAALVDGGYDAVALDVTILDPAPASFGEAVVHTRWAEAYNAGEYTAKEYGELVATTVESKRHPPEVGVSPTE